MPCDFHSICAIFVLDGILVFFGFWRIEKRCGGGSMVFLENGSFAGVVEHGLG